MSEKGEVVTGIVIAIVVVGGVYWIYRKTRPAVSSQGPSLPIDDTFAKKVRDDLIAKLTVKERKLQPTAAGEQGKIDRHRVFFIYRRALDLGIADPALRAGQGLETLKLRVELEVEQVNKFQEKTVGDASRRGPYFGGPEGLEVETRHLDLGKYVSPRLGDPPPTTEDEAVKAPTKSVSQMSTLRELDRRRMRVIGIIWRAAAIDAIDAKIWKDTGSGSSELQKADLTELLDCRLRCVERLQYEASAGATPKGLGSSHIERRWSLGNNSSTTGGPWKDDYPVRMFEAPSLPRTARSVSNAWVVEAFFNTSSNVITDASQPRFSGLGWYVNHTTNEFDWNVWPGTRIPSPRPVSVWRLVSDAPAGKQGSAWVLQPVPGGNQAAEIIRQLFAISEDWWQRSWLHSDGVLSALHLEALRHTLRRRKANEIEDKKTEEEKKMEAEERQKEEEDEKGDKEMLMRPGLTEKERKDLAERMSERTKKQLERQEKRDSELNKVFDALPAKYDLALDDYFEVRPKSARAPNGIMKRGKTDYFDNGAVRPADLQIGDQLLFETSPILFVLGSAAWDYPTVLVTDVDSYPGGEKLELGELKLQGFGTADLNFPTFQRLLIQTLDTTLNGVQEHIRRTVAISGIPITKLPWDTGLVLSVEDRLNNDPSLLQVWKPYGDTDTWDKPGPWWIRINLQATMWRGTFAENATKLLVKMPGGVLWIDDHNLLNEHSGLVSKIPVSEHFQEPPWESAVEAVTDPRRTIFVPLFEPDGGWFRYFKDKAASPTERYGPELNPTTADASWLPGLAKEADRIRVIRPRLKPAS